jgi:colicin import membrane protein
MDAINDPSALPQEPADLIPMPPAAEASETRKADIERGAALGAKRAEQERATKQRIKDRKEHEAELGRQATQGGVEKVQEQKQRKKQYRTVLRKRNEELAADKIREEKRIAAEAEQKKAQEEKIKQKKGYMKELRDTAAARMAMERRKKALVDLERERKKAEFDYHTAVSMAAQKHTQQKEQLERDLRSHKGLAQENSKQKMYQLENWYRMRMAAFDSEAKGMVMDVHGVKTAMDLARHKEDVMLKLRAKRRALDGEYKDRTQAIQNEEKTALLSIKDEDVAAHAMADKAEKNAINLAQLNRTKMLEDISHREDALRKGNALL